MKVAMVILAGPIKHWWDDNWDTPEHWHYYAWREFLSTRLVDSHGYLVYRPHHAFKGDWTERGQGVNDTALISADVVINMTPPGVPSDGTDGEVLLASGHGAIIVNAPPPLERSDFETGFQQLLAELETLGVRKDVIEQEKIIESLGYLPGREWLFRALFWTYYNQVARLHHLDERGHRTVSHATRVVFGKDGVLRYYPDQGGRLLLPADQLLKVEILDRTRS